MAKCNDYYYNMLPREMKQVYYAIYEALSKQQTSFAAPRMADKDFYRIYFMVRLDHPEIFYSTRFSYRFYEHADNMEVIPEYMFTGSKLKSHIQAMDARVRKLARAAEKMNEREKEKYIHDFICDSVTYDKLKKDYSHEIIGPLGNGVGVCEGIAKTVKILCDALGVWCIIALSEANPEKGIKYRHAWNVIKIDGKYYHLDVTFDNSLSKDGVVRYDYFNLPDVQIQRDHERYVYPLPECKDGKSTYYIEKKLSFTKEEDVRKRALQAAKKGKVLVFHWRGGYLTKEKVLEFFDIFKEEGEKKGKFAKVSLNWAQAVFKVYFTDIEESTEVSMEEANEGELYDGEQN